MKEITDKNLLYSKKGFLIIIFLICLIAMPICEYYFGLEFSTVFPIVKRIHGLLQKQYFMIERIKEKYYLIFSSLLLLQQDVFISYKKQH